MGTVRRPARTAEEIADRKLKAARLSLMRKELQSVRWFDRIREEKPSLFIQLICEGELGIPVHSGSVLFRELHRSDNALPCKPSMHSYLAKLILGQMINGRPTLESVYISLAAWIESNVDFEFSSLSRWRYGLDVIPLKGTLAPHDIYVVKVKWKFFEEATERLNWSVMKAARMVYRGVPLFRSNESSGGYYPVAEDCDEYVYLREKGRREEFTTSCTLPDWATNYFVRLDHVKAHDAIFFSDWDLSQDELELRRSILVAQCGTPGTPKYYAWPWGDHETKLLRSLAVAAREWWTTYDPSDPATAPTNDQVTSWLESQGESKRVAEVMAQILRADGLPMGPRK